MTLRKRLPEISITVGVLLLALWYCAAFVFPNHPRRPKNVPPSAALVFRGGHAYWQYCWLDESIQKDRCQIFNGDGVILVDDIFLPYSGTKPVPESRLKIDANNKTDTGNGLDYVLLTDRTILIQQRYYAAIRQDIPKNEIK